ncbi:hypothetical protein [Endozoicomonas sp. 8E]|uniref:hypothetical protein n=1 Tax=Endozoicomonas sp. 8E TaxID=3035692 RepID=UPI002938D3F8|nr:hypothetical protein [Endozoicomonas sp. 8E]WOG27044.1 hypothetical protein P6910_21215 [Endozoicomonas sp. 8E]
MLQQPLLNEGVNHSGYRFNNMAREAMTPKALVTGVVSADEVETGLLLKVILVTEAED